jgi:hypothetical protein
MDHVSKIETRPSKVWDAVEKLYRADFFENLIFEKYKHYFDAYDPKKQEIHIQNVKAEMAQQVLVIKQAADDAIAVERQECQEWQRQVNNLQASLTELSSQIKSTQSEDINRIVMIRTAHKERYLKE